MKHLPTSHPSAEAQCKLCDPLTRCLTAILNLPQKGRGGMVAIYARQSIDRPDSVSIETQVNQCRKFTAEESRVYADAGYSGKNINRPEFERMLKDIKNGKLTAVISYRLDRISRNIIDFANLLNTFEKHGVQYISATEQFDTSTPMGRAMIYIVMVFAQLERETIATRILDNYRFRSMRGLFMGGNTPFGYDSRRILLDGKKTSMLEPNGQAEVLRDIFRRFSSKESMIGICHELNRKGIKTAKGNLWSGNAVRRVLRNISPCCADGRLYDYLTAAGYSIANSRDEFDGQHGMCLFFKNKNRNQITDISDQIAVVGLHQPLISSEQYLHAQQILNTNAPARGKRSQRTFLAGLMKCKECGHSFGVKYTTRGNREYAYYRCRGRESRGVCENDTYLSACEMERPVIQACLSHIANIRFDDKAVEAGDVSSQALEIERLRNRVQNLIDNVGKGNAVVDDLLTREITSLQKQIEAGSASARVPEPVPQVDGKSLELIKQQLQCFSGLNIQVKIDVIRSMIKEIRVDKNGVVEIEYLF